MPIAKSIATSVSAVAFVAVSALVSAQTQPGANPAAEHLSAARAALNKVLNSPAPSGDAFKKMAEIKTEYLALEKAASTASPEWKTHYQAIDRNLVDLLGPATPAAESGAVGTSGGAAKPMDPVLTANLLDFRTHLAAFSKSMEAVSPAASAKAATATAPAPASAPAPAPAPPAAPAATASAPATAPASATPPEPAPAAQAAAPPSATTADIDTLAQLDQALATLEVMLKANAAPGTSTISVERSMLEQVKAQLEQVRAGVKKP